MDRNEVIANRERARIRSFLEAMVSLGRMTELERQVIRQEGEAVSRAAGHLDAQGKIIAAAIGGDDESAIARHSNHLERTKILELHPELEAELNRFIEHRPHHPLPPVPPNLARSGAALNQYRTLLKYIEEKRNLGEIHHNDAHAIFEPALQVFQDSGVFFGELNSFTDIGSLVTAHRLMKEKLLELYPEMSNEVRNLSPSQMR